MWSEYGGRLLPLGLHPGLAPPRAFAGQAELVGGGGLWGRAEGLGVEGSRPGGRWFVLRAQGGCAGLQRAQLDASMGSE